MLDFEKIYKNVEGNISCRGCTVHCCEKAGNIVLFPGESQFLVKRIKGIKDYIYEKKVKGQKIEIIKLPCPFLVNNLCSIEENRPLDCRLFPLDYCIYLNKAIIITSKSCPNLKLIPKNQIRENSKLMLSLLNKLTNEWLGSAILFGPCGNCDKTNCKLRHKKGYNDKDW